MDHDGVLNGIGFSCHTFSYIFSAENTIPGLLIKSSMILNSVGVNLTGTPSTLNSLVSLSRLNPPTTSRKNVGASHISQIHVSS